MKRQTQEKSRGSPATRQKDEETRSQTRTDPKRVRMAPPGALFFTLFQCKGSVESWRGWMKTRACVPVTLQKAPILISASRIESMYRIWTLKRTLHDPLQ